MKPGPRLGSVPSNLRSCTLISADRTAHQKASNAPTTDGFSAYSFNGWLIFTGAAERALKVAKPGMVEFRQPLDDEIFKTKELAGM